MTAFILFLLGIAAFVFALLRKVAGQTAAFDALEAKAKAAAEAVEKNQAIAIEAETHAAEVKESVSQRLAKLEDEVAEEKQRDTVDVANDIIGRN